MIGEKQIPIVSVIVPILNEEKYISSFLESLEQQDYAAENMEIFLVDGQSTDRTRSLIEDFQASSILNITLIDNPDKIQSSAMNLGIKHSVGKYIIRLDAHTIYESNYIRSCVELLDTRDVANVGFYLVTRGKGKVGGSIAKALSSPFGVGSSQFRISREEIDTDTVPFGAFRRDIFQEVGLFNEYLACNEDNDINSRIRSKGYKILLSNKSFASYFCRDTLTSLGKMAIRNGKWNVYSLYYSHQSMSIKYFIPFFFVAALVGSALLSTVFPFMGMMFALVLLSYMSVNSYFSSKLADNGAEFFRLLMIFFTFHFCYGVGSMIGIVGYIEKVIRKQPKFKALEIIGGGGQIPR